MSKKRNPSRKQKHDCVISVFELSNDRGFHAPLIDFHYQEKNGGRRWFVRLGGTKVYVCEVGDFGDLNSELADEQAVNAHLYVQNICACLAAIGCGLFKFRGVGRLLLKNFEVEGWGFDVRPNDPLAKMENSKELHAKFAGWFGICAENRMFRRALDDFYNSLIYPKEAPLFVYRALEWIKEGMQIEWSDIPKYLSLPKKEMSEFKKLLHDPDVAVRHGRASGKKMRANASLFGAWSANILEILNAIRQEKDPKYVPMAIEDMAKAVAKCVPLSYYE